MDGVHISAGDRVSPVPPARKTYRHGDLRRSLLDAGIALAREGGPDAIVLREATRRAGVVPNAAYRHFAGRQELFEAVRAAAFASLATAIEAELSTLPKARKPGAASAQAVLGAVGTGYLRFALGETGLFRTAFAGPFEPEADADPEKAGQSGMNPFQLLGSALDGMVAAGILPAGRRPGAEYLAWSAVHGMAMLAIDGPLHGRSAKDLQRLGQRLVEMVVKGL
jgi:AcrR family transcriptional regulator